VVRRRELISKLPKPEWPKQKRSSFEQSGLEHLKILILNLPFDLAQGGESFDFAQDREPVERPVEPFRASNFGFRISEVVPCTCVSNAVLLIC